MTYGVNSQRGSGFGGLTDGAPPPRDLLILVGVLFATFSLQFFEGTRAFLELFSLNLGIYRGFLWQLVTYPFVATPSSGFWFLLELLIVYWFGRTVYYQLGQRRFWRVLLTAAVGAAVVAVVVEWIAIAAAPSFSHLPFIAMLGQRMVLTILIAAFATLNGQGDDPALLRSADQGAVVPLARDRLRLCLLLLCRTRISVVSSGPVSRSF